MNFMGLIKRSERTDKVFEELEDVMVEALGENLLMDGPQHASEPVEAFSDRLETDEQYLLSEQDLQAEEEPAMDEAPVEEMLEAEVQPEPQPEPQPDPEPEPEAAVARRLTSHTQNRLAALSSFDGLYRDAQDYMREINEKLSEVITSHHLTREFFNIVHADIQRANELELSNAALVIEARKTADQMNDMSRRLQEREAMLEMLQQRETTLLQDKEALRAALSATRLELVESSNVIIRSETELGDVIKTLSTRTVEAERRMRENEVLREKQVNLAIDLDNALKREGEARRKLDEVSTIHANENARYTEMLAALTKSEKEVMRLQKANEVAHARHAEVTEAARNADIEREAETQRTAAEIRGLKSEIQSLQARLEDVSNENLEVGSEVAKLTAQLNDAVAERHVADEKLAALRRENDTDKQNLSAASANISQLSLQQASEQMQLDIHKQECEDLRAEIATLNDRIKELLPIERLYRVAKSRQHESAVSQAEAGQVGIVAEATRAASRRPNGAGRRRAI